MTPIEIQKDITSHLQLVLSEDEAFEFDNLDDMSASALKFKRVRRLVDEGAQDEDDGMIEYATPTISFDANGLTVDDVISAFIDGANACRTPDLNQDGTADCQAEDLAMLPQMFNDFVQGNKVI